MTSGRNAMTLLTRGRANSSHGAAVVRVGEQVHTEGSRAAGDEAEAGVAAVHAGVAGAGRVASLDGRAGLGAAGRGGGNALGTVSAAGREALVATERAAAAEAERSGVRGGSGASIADEVCRDTGFSVQTPGLRFRETIGNSLLPQRTAAAARACGVLRKGEPAAYSPPLDDAAGAETGAAAAARWPQVVR